MQIKKKSARRTTVPQTPINLSISSNQDNKRQATANQTRDSRNKSAIRSWESLGWTFQINGGERINILDSIETFGKIYWQFSTQIYRWIKKFRSKREKELVARSRKFSRKSWSKQGETGKRRAIKSTNLGIWKRGINRGWSTGISRVNCSEQVDHEAEPR